MALAPISTAGDSPGYTPIADSNGTVVDVRPEYYGVKLFTLAGMGTLLETAVAAGGLNVTAYAVRGANGNLSIVIVNKEPQALSVSLECGQPPLPHPWLR